jgi:hypothetical protein
MMAIKFTVEELRSPYSGRVPWDKAHRHEGLSERGAITMLNRLYSWYHHGTSWSGHVRVVGTDDWVYDVERDWAPGSRSKLARMIHLDDLSS